MMPLQIGQQHLDQLLVTQHDWLGQQHRQPLDQHPEDRHHQFAGDHDGQQLIDFLWIEGHFRYVLRTGTGLLQHPGMHMLLPKLIDLGAQAKGRVKIE